MENELVMPKKSLIFTATELEEIRAIEANREFSSNNHRSRNGDAVQFLVLHYTAVPLSTTLGIFTNNAQLTEIDEDYFTNTGTDPAALCKNEVSAHYVISEPGDLYQLVDEERAAYHAGVSFWNGLKNINNQSIGVEHVNIGYDWLNKFPEERAVKVLGSENTWCNFTDEQIEKTIALCNQIINRHDIKPYNVIGHSDIACGRKSDPGPMFPWKRLAEAGIGLWYDLAESNIQDNIPNNSVLWVREKLAEFGYDCPREGEFDDALCSVMKAFQMHFRQDNIDGNIDLECMQILDSLCQRKLNCELQNNSKPEKSKV
jgi:N-acetyl-anhydromuramyl-L-alanine amidase AmpD